MATDAPARPNPRGSRGAVARLPWTESSWRTRVEPRGVLVACAIALLAAALVTAAALRGRELSPLDEATHADYALQIAHGHIPARGWILAPEIRREWSCRGAVLVEVPPCADAPGRPEEYPGRGENYNFGHPPLYYAVVGFGARAVDALVPGAHFVAIGRLFGLAWLLAGMGVFYMAVRRLGVASTYALGAVAVIPLCPGVIQASATVTNDATAVLGGAIALWVLVRVLQEDRRGWVLPAVVTVLITATKVVSALPMLGVAAAVGGVAFVARREGDRARARELALVAAAIGAAFVLVFQGWGAFQSLRGPSDWINPVSGNPARAIHGSPVNELLSTSFSGFGLMTSYWLHASIRGETVTLWGRLLGVLVSAAGFLVLLEARPRDVRWLVGVITLGGLLAFPLVAELHLYSDLGEYFPSVVGRYGLSFVPWALCCLAIIAATRKLRRTTLAVAGIGAAVMLLAVFGVWSLGPA
jgi:hypothetical protein